MEGHGVEVENMSRVSREDLEPRAILRDLHRKSRRLGIFLMVSAGHTVSETSEDLGIPLTTVIYHVKRLEKMGLIRRIEGLDKRGKRYTVTELGEKVLDLIADKVDREFKACQVDSDCAEVDCLSSESVMYLKLFRDAVSRKIRVRIEEVYALCVEY